MGCQSYSSLRYWNTQYKCLFLTWNRDDAYSSVPSPPKQITKSILLVNSSFSTDQDKSAWIHKISTEFYILQVFHCYTEFKLWTLLTFFKCFDLLLESPAHWVFWAHCIIKHSLFHIYSHVFLLLKTKSTVHFI